MGKYTEADIKKGKRIMKNGMLAGFVQTKGGLRFRIIGMVDKAKHQKSVTKKRGANRRVKLSPRGAMAAFNKYYKTSRKYTKDSSRKASRTRDLCHSNQKRSGTRSYSRSPHLYDYRGVDDGKRCPGGNRGGKKKVSATRRKVLLANLKKARAAKRTKRGGRRQQNRNRN